MSYSVNRFNIFSNPQEDANQLAVLIWEIFNGFTDRVIPKAPAPGKISSRLLDLYKKLASPAASKISFNELIRGRNVYFYFSNPRVL